MIGDLKLGIYRCDEGFGYIEYNIDEDVELNVGDEDNLEKYT